MEHPRDRGGHNVAVPQNESFRGATLEPGSVPEWQLQIRQPENDLLGQIVQRLDDTQGTVRGVPGNRRRARSSTQEVLRIERTALLGFGKDWDLVVAQQFALLVLRRQA